MHQFFGSCFCWLRSNPSKKIRQTSSCFPLQLPPFETAGYPSRVELHRRFIVMISPWCCAVCVAPYQWKVSREKRSHAPVVKGRVALLNERHRQFRNELRDPMGKCVFFFWSRQTGTIYPLLSTMIRRFFQTAAGMCKNPGGRTSTTRTYHSLGAMLPSNWSIVDPM